MMPARLFAAALLVAALTGLHGSHTPAVAAPIPSAWATTDLPAGPLTWWGAEVARFPSVALAQGVRDALEAQGWGPVIVVQSTNEATVILGELTSRHEARFVAQELAAQRLAEARVAPVVPGAHSEVPRGVYGPFQTPYPESATGTIAKEALEAQLTALAASDTDAKGPAELLLGHLKEGTLDNPAAGTAAGIIADLLWKRRTEPDLILFLAGRIIRGEYAATAEQRWRAEVFAAELLFTHRGLWRDAWAGAANIIRQHPDPVERGRARLLQSALIMDLVRRGESTPEAIPEVRRLLREGLEAIPNELTDLSRKFECTYIQTFAWQGDWDRVAELGPAFLSAHPDPSPERVVVLTLMGLGLERSAKYDDALSLLNEARNIYLLETGYFRLGMDLRDPRRLADLAWNRMSNLSVGLDPAPMPRSREEEAAATAPVETPAPDPAAAPSTELD